MKPNYKKIDKVNLPKQYFICSGERTKEKDQYCIYFSDIENKEMILEAIKNIDNHYIQILSDTKEDLYQSTVRILKSCERAEKKPKMAIDGHTRLLCKRHKIKIDSGVVEYLQSHDDEWIDVLFENFESKAKIKLYKKIYQDNHQLLSSRLTILNKKEPKAMVKLSNNVSMYNVKILRKYGII